MSEHKAQLLEQLCRDYIINLTTLNSQVVGTESFINPRLL